jgi:hypothetical protein
VIGHPFAAVILLVAAVAARRAGPAAALEPLAVIGAAVLLPLWLFMSRRARSGRWSNIDASERTERPALYAVALGLLICVGVFVVRSPRLGYLGRGILSTLLLLVLAGFLNRWIKASLHLAFGAYTGVVLLRFAPALGLAVLAFLLPLGWARVAMHRHTVLEVCVGAAIGMAVGALAVSL